MRKFYLFSCYFVQGLALSFFLNFQKPFLSAAGLDIDSIAKVSAIMVLPFVLKILVGYISDKFPLFGLGHRKPYILFGILMGSAGFLMAGAVDPVHEFPAYASYLFLAAFGLATFDAISDGYAIDQFNEDRSAEIQSVMIAGRGCGLIFGALLFGQWIGSSQLIFFALSASFLFPLIAFLTLPKNDLTRTSDLAHQRPGFRFGGHLLPFAILAILHTIITMGTDSVVTLGLSLQRGFDFAAIGNYSVIKGCLTVVGALAFGLFSKRMGLSRAAPAAFLSFTLPLAFTALIWTNLTPPLGGFLGGLWGFGTGAIETAFVSIAMTKSHYRNSAAVFASWMALANLGSMTGTGLMTKLLTLVGPQTLFLSSAVGLATMWLAYSTLTRPKRETKNMEF